MGQNHCRARGRGAKIEALLALGVTLKRDDDFLRQLLLEIEASDDWLYECDLLLGSDEAEARAYYHMQLLADAGLVQESDGGGLFRLTNAGHDFIALTRQNEAWEATKSAARSLGGASLQMLLNIAESYARRKLTDLGLPLA